MKIRGYELSKPIVQGGMGIGISLDQLAGAVACEGGMGVVSSAFCGMGLDGFEKNPKEISLEAIAHRLKLARKKAGASGLVGINIMCAVQNYKDQVMAAAKAGADAIISGAGLPLQLPSFVPEGASLLAPIVGSGRVTTLICRYWKKHYNRLPDFIVLEGPQAGGHLGYDIDQLEGVNRPTRAGLCEEVKKAIAPFEESKGEAIPLVVGGGICAKEEVDKLLALGARAVQIGTRFIATEECDATQGFKDVIIKAKEEDVVIVKSPVGMPGRAVHSPLMQAIASGERRTPKKCFNCLTPCNPSTTPYCISTALMRACLGDWENGLFFCGSEVGKVHQMTKVKQVFEELLGKDFARC